MKRILVVGGVAVLLALVGSRADAASITFGSTTIIAGGCTTNDNTNFNGAQVLTQVMGCFGAPNDPLTLLYKQDVGASTDEGTFASSYNTSFYNSPLDPKDAAIANVGSSYMDCLACYLVVKDGNHSPAQYFFNISSWNGTDTLFMNGFWPYEGAISNVAIWGQATTVPEPATLLLVGAGLGLAALRKRRTA